MRQSTKPQVVQAIDSVWDRMRREAEDIARKEPVLGGFIFSAVLNHNTFNGPWCTAWPSAWASGFERRTGGAGL